MANRLEDEAFAYRSDIESVLPPAQQYEPDETHYDTIKIVSTKLHKALDELSDFRTFPLSKDVSHRKALDILDRQIGWRQEAYEFLMPWVDLVDKAIQRVDIRANERRR